jgi:putative cell wall-binding protein
VPGGGAANASTGTASVRGVVVMPDGLAMPTGGNQLRAVKVSLADGVLTGVVSTLVAQDGSFVLSGLAAGVQHRILFTAGFSASLLRSYHDGAFTYESTVPLVLTPGENRDLGSIQMFRPGSISGSLSNVAGTDFTPEITIVSGPSQLGGVVPTYNRFARTYVIGGLYPGTYVVRFSQCCQGANWKSVYNGQYLTQESAVPITVGLSESVVLDATLPESRSISGVFSIDRDPTVTTPVLNSINVRPFPGLTAGTPRRDIRVTEEGAFRIQGLEPGAYQICTYSEPSPVYQATFSHCFGQDEANPDGVPVIMGAESIEGIDLRVPGAARITLRDVGRPDPSNAGGRVPTNHIFAFFWRFDETLGYWVNEAQASHIGGAFGTLMSPPIPAGDYRIQLQYQFTDGVHEPTQQYREYFPGGVTRFSDAGIITVVEGESRIIASTTVSPTPLGVDRVWGLDRFSGSAAISQQVVPDAPAPVVYIANGLNYPDALSAVPLVSGLGGSLLLVWPDQIPSSVEAELRRLQPERIVIVGGTASVSPAVESRLRTFVDSPGDVERHAGIDRYEASRTAIERVVGDTEGIPVIIATGSNYPDALAAGPVAAALGGVVLLVDGSSRSLDAPTRALLNRLQPSLFIIAGGPGSVSPGIEAELLRRSDQVFRAGGEDRYEAAATLNSILLPIEGFRYDRPDGADLVFVASGANFADALAGGPLAARHGAPLYLTPPTCLTSHVIDAVEDHGAREIVIIGGPASVTRPVEVLFLCGMSATRGEVTELQRAVAEALN